MRATVAAQSMNLAAIEWLFPFVKNMTPCVLNMQKAVEMTRPSGISRWNKETGFPECVRWIFRSVVEVLFFVEIAPS